MCTTAYSKNYLIDFDQILAVDIKGSDIDGKPLIVFSKETLSNFYNS